MSKSGTKTGDLTTYRESLMVDVRVRYDQKTACLQTDPYVIPAKEFDNDRTKWPEVGYVDVVNYLLFNKSSYTKDQLKNYKSLEAYKLFQDGWIKELLHKDVQGVHLFRAKVINILHMKTLLKNCFKLNFYSLKNNNQVNITHLWSFCVIS